MADTAWKKAERQVAKRFGTEREGPMGEYWPDAISKSYAIEVKNRDELPQWLHDAMDQAERNARLRAPDKLAILALHQRYQDYDKCFVVVRLADFIEWFGQ